MLAVVVGLGSTGSALAGLAEGLMAYDAGDYATAIRELSPLADGGSAIAQYTLARMYFAGQGVAQSVESGLTWERKAAEKGEPHAQYQLASRYEYGLGVAQDYGKAVKWYGMAAERDLAAAQFRLGLLYANGLGVPADIVAAHMWLNLAVAKLPPGEVRNGAARFRDGLASKMSAAQISEAQKLARGWKPRTQN